ncbi:subtilase family protein [Actinidia rufa]|uniref:Subtilase family protein n=1 Tax=Actinidia rufa TaxID=165716 RepID=A0A7J0DMR7_9ERIC|nr:subtilase family protein [Actinidia rufa]
MGSIWVCFIAFLLPCLTVAGKHTYIVHMNHNNKPLSYATQHDWYSAHLQSITSDSSADSLLYTYTNAFHGFAASLSPDEVESLRRSDAVLGVYEDTIYSLHTTRTPEFLGLDPQLGLWAGHSPQELNQASQDVIIGVLDTGVWPESKSFDDSDMPAVPSRWQGECESGPDFDSKLLEQSVLARFARAGVRAWEVGVVRQRNQRARGERCGGEGRRRGGDDPGKHGGERGGARGGQPSDTSVGGGEEGGGCDQGVREIEWESDGSAELRGDGSERVNILAAWALSVGPTGLHTDTRKTPFNIMSGTSMSCPHISGLAALLKAAHPEWSPSAIKSALMTTAYTKDNTNSPLRDAAEGSFSTPLAHGSGHVDPHKALSPGLVYDISTDDYIAFLCSLDYTIQQVRAVAKHPNITCRRKFADPGQLNYPSFSVLFAKSKVVRYTRELTNVGAAGSVYEVAVDGPPTVAVTVKPARLVFRNVGDKLRYTVTFVSKKGANPTARNAFGSLAWNNAQHQVRSPITYAWTQL